ncbi:hypothetical protein Golax_003703, partial [Gossypium laxum]|nr:hypothetical protein [Gossypium laxum]
VVALAVVSIGAAVATVTDLQFNLLDYSKCNKQDPLVQLMWKTTPISLICLLIMIPTLDPPGAFSYSWNYINTSMILISGVSGFLLQWSAALALGATSAISHVVLGQFKTCVLPLGNYYIFGSNPGTTSICGAFVAIAGMSFYTYLNLQNGKLKSGKQSPRKVHDQETKDINVPMLLMDNLFNFHGIFISE